MKTRILPLALTLLVLAGCSSPNTATITPSVDVVQSFTQPVNSTSSNDMSSYGLEWVVEPTFEYEDVQPVSVMLEYAEDRIDPTRIYGYRCKDYYTFRQNGKWGLMETSTGKVLVEAKYEAIFEHYENLQDHSNVRYLLEDASDFSVADVHESKSTVTKGNANNIGMDDNDGEAFDYYDKATDKLMYVVQERRGSQEYRITEESFSDLYSLLPIYSGYKEEDGWKIPTGPIGCANPEGFVLDCIYEEYSEIRSFDESDAQLKSYEETGDDSAFFLDGLKFMKEDKWTYINEQDGSVLQQQFDAQFAPAFGNFNKPFSSSEGYIPVCIEGKAGYFNNDYEEVVPLIFEQTRPMQDGQG